MNATVPLKVSHPSNSAKKRQRKKLSLRLFSKKNALYSLQELFHSGLYALSLGSNV